jgi:hypothetical protein
MERTMRVAFILLAVLAAACSSSSPERPVLREVRPASIAASGGTVDVHIPQDRAIVGSLVLASPEATWAALRRAYADLGIPVIESSSASRTLGNPRFLVSRRLGSTPLSRFLSCGAGLHGPFADNYRVEMFVRSTVVPGDDGTSELHTYVEARARNPEGTSNTVVPCSSTRRLERDIATRVHLLVAGG